MIVITLPVITAAENIDRFMIQLNHFEKYHPDYAGKEFRVEKDNLSLVKIEGDIDRSLFSHLQEAIKEHMPQDIL